MLDITRLVITICFHYLEVCYKRIFCIRQNSVSIFVFSADATFLHSSEHGKLKMDSSWPPTEKNPLGWIPLLKHFCICTFTWQVVHMSFAARRYPTNKNSNPFVLVPFYKMFFFSIQVNYYMWHLSILLIIIFVAGLYYLRNSSHFPALYTLGLQLLPFVHFLSAWRRKAFSV